MSHGAEGQGCWWSSSMADAMPPPSQNKCFRYWPELHGSQEYGRLRVCNVAEHQAQGYCVRELQVWRADQVSLEGNETCGARVRVVGKSPGLRWGEEALGWPWWLARPSIQWAQSWTGLCWAVFPAGHVLSHSCLAPGRPHTHMHLSLQPSLGRLSTFGLL